jgi:ketosteroid isomerase-like protein
MMCAVSLSAALLAMAGPEPEAVKAEAMAVRREFFVAVAKGDRGALDRLLAPDFTFVHSTGVLEGRDSYIERAVAAAQPARPNELEFLGEDLRVYGGTTAVCVSRSVSRRGTPGELNFRGTDVLVKDGGRWRLAAVHSTRLATRPRAANVSPEKLDQYAGAYVVTPGRTLQVTRDGDILRGTLQGIRPTELVPVSDSEFVWFDPDSNADLRITFERNASGGALTAILRADGVERWRAAKAEAAR